MPVVDALSADYADRVDFVAPAWKSDFDRTHTRALELFISEKVMWGLDEDEDIFDKYGVPYQPVTVLITNDKRVYTSWTGVKSEEEIRAELDALLALSA